MVPLDFASWPNVTVPEACATHRVLRSGHCAVDAPQGVGQDRTAQWLQPQPPGELSLILPIRSRNYLTSYSTPVGQSSTDQPFG